jgi:Mlc titration factor MtfA (ptsG expression regulator)
LKSGGRASTCGRVIEAVAVAALLVAAALAPWAPALLRRLRRAHRLRGPFPAAWRRMLQQRMPLYARLPPPLQRELRRHVQVFVAEVPFVGCAGLVVRDEMRVLVAAQAALLRLGRPPGAWPNLRQVLLYPGAFIVDRVATDGLGLQRDERRVLAGESWQQGQVVLSWGDVIAGAADPDDGRNVVLHEFAHQLDQERGAATGAPFLGRRDAYAAWAAAFGEAFADLRRRVEAGEPSVLDAYGAAEPAEFFACATEAFFERPAALAAEQPALARELAAFYRCDPRAWTR